MGSNDENFYAISPDGALKWSCATQGPVRSSPAIDIDGTVYVGSDDRLLHVFNPDGTYKWRFNTGNHYASSPAIDAGGIVYVSGVDLGTGYKYVAINQDSSLGWTYTLDWRGVTEQSSLALGDDGTAYIYSHEGTYEAINPGGGRKWLLPGLGGNTPPAIDADGTAYINGLKAISPDGSLKWIYGVGGESAPAIGADGTAYLGGNDGVFYAINPDGTLKWSYNTGTALDISSSPAIGSDGTVYVGSDDGCLYAFGP